MTNDSARRVLVIADTHNKLPERVRELAQRANEIWHLGDVCRTDILDELKSLGPPVTLVRGNCDSNFEWPLVVDLTRNGTRFRLQHIPPSPRRTPADCDVLLHGHTHVPRDETISGVRFLNPGCVTRPNRGAPPSVAWLTTDDGILDWRLIPLRLS
ncbi:MAG: metallophosphoesterase [Chthoniobacterales bacterium]|nr:MAG: metallophosphoesterase [Chthoniobacterales bacterium]